jgi:hypothetical protein
MAHCSSQKYAVSIAGHVVPRTPCLHFRIFVFNNQQRFSEYMPRLPKSRQLLNEAFPHPDDLDFEIIPFAGIRFTVVIAQFRVAIATN